MRKQWEEKIEEKSRRILSTEKGLLKTSRKYVKI